MTAPFVDELLRGRSDRHKPTYSQLRDEGVSQCAIELLHEGRDMLELGWSPYGFAQWQVDSRINEVVSAADVPLMERVEFVEHTFPLADDWDDLERRVASDWDLATLNARLAIESREVEASNARQDARYSRHDRTKAATS